jgi:hypothetical protein
METQSIPGLFYGIEWFISAGGGAKKEPLQVEREETGAG